MRYVKYNPAFLSEEELVRSFVVRHDDLDLIVRVIRENVSRSNQHVLVLGPRGIGKTMLALRVVAEVRRTEKLRDRWYPIVFAEESYPVCTPGEFWLEALFHIARQTGEERWKCTHEELTGESDEVQLRERALAQLMDFADEQGKRLLLVVENLNMLLGGQISSDDAWVLRHTLTNEPRVMLLATATNVHEEVENSGKAFFELFKLHKLNPLDQNECREIWTAMTGREPTDQRIRPIQILTGGNPRLLTIISGFAARLSFQELMGDLMQLVDDHTEYFKSHLDKLAAIERKAYLALAELWDPATARQVAGAARLDVSKTSSLLNRLIGRGAVVVADERRRTKWYQVAERMYNIYYLMRRRGAPSSRVRAIVNFMTSFYGEQELVRLTHLMAEEACQLEPEVRQYHYLVFDGILKSVRDEGFRDQLLGAIPDSLLEAPDAPSSIRKFVRKKQRHDLRQLLGRVDALSEKPEGLEEAERLCRKAVEIAPDVAWGWAYLGRLLQVHLQRYDEAEKAYRKAVELQPDYAWTWAQLGELLHENLKRYDEAENAYREAVEVKPDYAWAWAQLGRLLHENLKRHDEAETAYRKVVELEPDYAWACWAQLGWILAENLERYDEAEKAYRKAVELKPDFAPAWTQLGWLLAENLERYDEAEKAYRKAVELKPDYAQPWAHLGLLLHLHSARPSEAEKAYRKAIELNPDLAPAWGSLGLLLHREFDRRDEAEKAYRKAIDLDPDAPLLVWQNLVVVISQDPQREKEARELVEAYLAKKPRDVAFLNGLAWAAHSLRRPSLLSRAEEWSRQAFALEGDSADHQHTLACILAAQGKTPEALELASRYLKSVELVENRPQDATELSIELAAAGSGREALEILQRSPSAKFLEPLVVGLRLFLGDDVKAATEILEVGKDVAERIQNRQDETRSQRPSAGEPSKE